MVRALIVDDEAEQRASLSRLLGLLGFKPVVAAGAEEALEAALREEPRLIFADWCLRGRSGLALVRDLRADVRTRHLPIVVMSAIKESAEDEVRAIEAGADRFYVKWELSLGSDKGATLKRHLSALVLLGAQRAGQGTQRPEKILQMGDLCVDPARAEVAVGGQKVSLTPKEYELLEFFMRRPDVIHSAERIWRSVWGTPRTGNWEHTLTSTLSAVRKALGFEWSSRLVNVRTLGYRLLSPEPPRSPDLSRPS